VSDADRRERTRHESSTRCNAARAVSLLFRSARVPARQKSTAMPPRSVASFHENSRLHFIGSWRARYEAFLDAKGVDDDDFSSPPRVVMHVDMDCFFAACATRDRPDLANIPVAVSWGTSTSRRGEISSCNYEARRFGVAAGQDVFAATTKCPDLLVVPYDFETIERVGLEVYEILFAESKGRCVGVSVDEAFLDADAVVGGAERNGKDADKDAYERAAETLRAKVYAKTRCACSIGIGSNALLARMATRRAKPDGVFRVRDEETKDFLATTAARDIPGFGRRAAEKLATLGIVTCEDARRARREDLVETLGAKSAERLVRAARGVDETPWRVRPRRKTVGAQMSWGVRCADDDVAIDFVRQLAREVSQRMQKLKIVASKTTLKLWRAIADAPPSAKHPQGHGACDVLTRTRPMKSATNDADEIADAAIATMRELRAAATMIRGLGVSCSKLDDAPSAATARRQPTLSQMFRTGDREKNATEAKTNDAEEEDIAETESERDDDDEDEDVARTQSQLLQNDCDVALFNDSQAEMDSDRTKALRAAYAAAARRYAWQRHELARLRPGKRRRETISQDEYAARAVAASADVVIAHARRAFVRDGESGLRAFTNEARALCRSQELLPERFGGQGASFAAAWLHRVDAVEAVVFSA